MSGTSAGLVLAVALSLLAAVPTAAGAAVSSAWAVTPYQRTARSEPPGDAAGRPLWGVSTDGAPADMAEVEQLADLVGESPDLVLYFRGWPYHGFDATEAQRIVDAGSTPLLTWEPYDYRQGAVQPDYALSTIVEGRHDTYIRAFARDVAGWGGRLLLRFAHEMNTDAYPWSATANGGSPAAYVAAWHHVHDIFRQEGADAVEWVWAPNVSYAGTVPLGELYPGDAAVDWVGVDGYNGGDEVDWGGWLGFSEIFDATLDELTALTDRPILITETGSSAQGGDRPTWLRDAFEQVRTDPRIAGVVYFNHDREADWRVQTSPDAAAAFAAGVRSLAR